jgi:hypothetical protein
MPTATLMQLVLSAGILLSLISIAVSLHGIRERLKSLNSLDGTFERWSRSWHLINDDDLKREETRERDIHGHRRRF